MSNFISVNIVVFKGDKYWVAQCLEFNLCSQGDSVRNALDGLAETMAANLIRNMKNKEQPFANCDPASEYYYKLHYNGNPAAQKMLSYLPIDSNICISTKNNLE